ncbi:hypothetical protein [Streptomyces sp. DSM 40167]|uniref:hypothetical protein n=1 Tax=unclassified Streptomyces TaxID=2593676 RepID=UPI00277EE8FC|nr:hypothetical protein [Streptomyces sp. DSM 40167]MDQ0404531.1 hypothetical protein [Streptomyces sp. DSM 40167]
MGWGRTGLVGERRPARPNDEWNRAIALCAGQVPLVWLAWWFAMQAGRDDYDYGGGGYLGICCVPLILPFVGLLHAAVQIAPAAALARLLPRTSPGPEWAWHLAGSVLIGAGWSALGLVLWGWPVTDTLPWFVGVGVLPVLVLHALRGRSWGGGGVWLRSAGTSFVLFVVCGVAAASLAEDYEPPQLSAARLAGEWRGEDGGVLRLAPGGRAELTRVPAHDDVDEEGDFSLCDGTGTWTFEQDSRLPGSHRDGVLVRLDGECGQETHWTIGGTERNPELFVLFGDPDAGELRILTRD